MMGTVVGMIRAFISSAAANTMTPATVSKGIGEALLCTAGGLIVAAITTVEYNYFVGRVNKFVLKVQLAGTARSSASCTPMPAVQRHRHAGRAAARDGDGMGGAVRKPRPPTSPSSASPTSRGRSSSSSSSPPRSPAATTPSTSPCPAVRRTSSRLPKTINVKAGENAVTVNGVPLAPSQLESYVASLLTGVAKEEDRAVMLFPDEDLSFQRTAESLYAIQKAGGIVVISEERRDDAGPTK